MLQGPNIQFTFVTGKRSGRQRLSDKCTLKFDIESIPICDGGAPIHVTKVALDHIEVAVHHDDSSSAPNTEWPESSRHCYKLWLVMIESGFLKRAIKPAWKF